MKRTIIIMALCMMAHSVDAQKQYTVNDCIDSALVYNRTLQNAALEIEAATHQRKEAHTKYYPEVKANITAFQTFDKILKSDALGLSELNRGYGATVSVMQPVYAGGQIVTANKLAEVQEDICRLQLELKEKDIRDKITENYWQICIIRYNLNTIAAAERQIAAVREQVQNLVNAGVTTPNAMLQVKLRENELKANRLKLENADKTLTMLLAQQVGKPGLSIYVPDENDVQTLPPLVNVAEAVERRSELALANKATEAQRLMVKMEQGKNLPTVGIGVMGTNVGLGGLSDNVKAMTKTNITNGVVLGTVSIPISSWWTGKHAIRRMKIKLREAENQVLDARENLHIDIMSSYNDLSEAHEQIAIAKASVEEAEENLRMYTDRYRSGTVTITDLLDAETLNRKAHDQLSSSIATYNIKLQAYKQKSEGGKR